MSCRIVQMSISVRIKQNFASAKDAERLGAKKPAGHKQKTLGDN